jgi:hypothetical protein
MYPDECVFFLTLDFGWCFEPQSAEASLFSAHSTLCRLPLELDNATAQPQQRCRHFGTLQRLFIAGVALLTVVLVARTDLPVRHCVVRDVVACGQSACGGFVE